MIFPSGQAARSKNRNSMVKERGVRGSSDTAFSLRFCSVRKSDGLYPGSGSLLRHLLSVKMIGSLGRPCEIAPSVSAVKYIYQLILELTVNTSRFILNADSEALCSSVTVCCEPWTLWPSRLPSILTPCLDSMSEVAKVPTLLFRHVRSVFSSSLVRSIIITTYKRAYHGYRRNPHGEKLRCT